ncbi:MAG: 1-acyl-sn-glycerol-3-phosphate acyltransferase [Parasporobacterium sp.]|nr:1-acyl-sn-glycerol-3-phosphate acyltransferase [Parasporobacterium sp.]MBR3642473.1 1-acyl-sn-glycerol-3-phosphate acyltransferase [Parasporobacterium sp.]
MSQPDRKVFRIDKLPMDIGRFFLLPLIPFYRIKKIFIGNGEKGKALKGGVILASNHTGFSDPMVLETAYWYRRVHYVVGEIAMGGKVRSAFMKAAGCIRIDRNSTDIKAIKECSKVLKEGFPLTMFPQGGIAKEDAGFKSGVLLIAVQADVPILPVYIVRRKHWWQRMRLVIGEPFNWHDHCEKKRPGIRDMERMTEILEGKYEECRTWESKEN